LDIISSTADRSWGIELADQVVRWCATIAVRTNTEGLLVVIARFLSALPQLSPQHIDIGRYLLRNFKKENGNC